MTSISCTSNLSAVELTLTNLADVGLEQSILWIPFTCPSIDPQMRYSVEMSTNDSSTFTSQQKSIAENKVNRMPHSQHMPTANNDQNRT